MASKKKQKRMVLQHERTTTPVADHSPTGGQTWPWRAKEGGMERGLQVTSQELDSSGNMSLSKEAICKSGGRLKHLVGPGFQADNLSADMTCNNIKVTLDNNAMWNEFYRCDTEMILTKQGSRMFPYCRFRISGLKPSRRYSLIMDIQPSDDSRYRWTGKSWQAVGKAEVHVKSEPFAHPDSPALGQHWMQNPVSFFRLKLTNSQSEQKGNTILRPMHRYLPRLHVVPEKASNDLHGSGMVTFTFPQTEFMAVSAYQNAQFAQLKVDCNPFSKGLKDSSPTSLGQKLKANSIRESNKDEFSSDNEQHPVKKSLKSLLANHKPKNLKTLDSKCSPSEDLQRKTVTSRDQSAPRVPGECSGNVSHPGQKLFSELIRDAHVSLHRCDLDQLSLDHGSSGQLEQSSTKSTGLRGKDLGVVQKESVPTKMLAKKDRKIPSTTNSTEEEHCINVLNCKGSVKMNSPCPAAPTGVQSSSKDLDIKSNSDASSEAVVRQHKRPPRLPLPALALFLKQHSTKSKKSKQESSSALLPSEHESLTSPEGSACLPTDLTNAAIDPSNDLKGETPESDMVCRESVEGVHLDQGGLNATLLTDEMGLEPSSPSPTASGSVQLKTDCGLVSVPDQCGLDATLSHSTVFPESDPSCCTQTCTTATNSTSSEFPTLPPPCNSVLPVPNMAQTHIGSSTLHSDSGSPKPDSVLPDPGCSSFSFETLSPASSPEQLPSLSDSMDFQLDSTVSEAGLTVGLAKNSMQEQVPSVFQWHTVLPPPHTYIDPSFTAFQPTQTVDLMSTSPPLLPSSTSPHPEPQSASVLPPDPPPSFQETEQSLPFPTELSPLALHLSLSPSPSFSPLDGEGLSPTPSLTDLVQLFSVDELGVEFTNTEAAAAPGPSLPVVAAQEPPQGLESVPVSKTGKRKKSHRRKLTKTDSELVVDEAAYQSMQPNLEEVEEQLFVSFTSKEALKLHIVDSNVESATQPQTVPEVQQTAERPEKPENESPHEPMLQFQEDLLRDLKLMKHRQVIHPVLQEVGLKMNLLDPMLAIDLQYLGVRLPLPPPGAQSESTSQELPPSEAAFVSRTGKTTDVTQIKGWREKFSSTEAPPVACSPEVGPSSEPQKKKNLSAFCSDMLDEYLENEGRLIDERAASFSQPPVEPPIYQLPTQSSSYVRTLDHILKKQDASNPAADLISGFIPPSKRPRPPDARVGKRKPKILKPKPRSESVSEGPQQGTAGLEPGPVKPVDQTTTTQETEPAKKRRRFKPRTTTPPPGLEDLAPLESDSELGPDCKQTKDSTKTAGKPLMARAVLKQKDLEDAVMWEGRPRTGITEERANVALTSLFTLTGFVREDPLAPVQVKRRRPARCLNDFCRLGCVCSSLFTSRRPQHCGQLACMFGCSCLKQKVVVLKNLDGSDCGPASHPSGKKRRRRMKMAYILKETDSVFNPAERVKALWWMDASEDPDPEPIHIPLESTTACQSSSNHKTPKSTKATLVNMQRSPSSCARVRVYSRKNKVKEVTKDIQPQSECVTKNILPKETPACTATKPCNSSLSREDVKGVMKDTKPKPKSMKKKKQLTKPPTCPVCPSTVACNPDDAPKPSKRLFIMADCQWGIGERSYVLKRLCEAMARDQLDRPFWIKNYFIRPSGPIVEGDTEPCIHYKVHISRPADGHKDSHTPVAAQPAGRPGGPQVQKRRPAPLAQDNVAQVSHRGKSPEQDEETVEDWQRAVEEADLEEEEEQEKKEEEKKKEVPDGADWSQGMVGNLGLPFLTGISPAGLLSANRKQPGGSNQLVKVNGKLYPLAKIQLGMMGALHPANRLAAYLTGRVGPGRRLQTPSSSSSPPTSSPSNPQSSGQTDPSLQSGLASPLILPPALPQTSFTTSLLPMAPAPEASQLLKIQVQGPPGRPLLLAPPPAGQKLLLQPPPPAPGATYYQRPDGKLVEVLVNKLTAFSPKSDTQLTSPAAAQPPLVTFLNANSQLTPVNPVYSSLPSSTGTRRLTSFPGSSKGSAPVVKPPSQPPSTEAPLAPSPPPVDFSFTPVADQGVEPGVATVMSHQQKPASIETCHLPRHQSPPPPAVQVHTLERGRSDEVQERVTMDIPQVEVELAPCSDVDDSSESDSKMEGDWEKEDEEEEDEEQEDDEEEEEGEGEEEEEQQQQEEEEEVKVGSKRERATHNLLEKKRRHQMFTLFERLRQSVGLPSKRTSKMATLHKAAQVIKDLQKVEKELLEKKNKLLRKQNKFQKLLPKAEEPVDEPMVISSDEERHIAETRHERQKTTNQQSADGGASHSPAPDKTQDDGMKMSPHPQPTPQAPPSPASAPPSPKVVPPVRRPTLSHRAPVQRVRPRTIPNILSRSKRFIPRAPAAGKPTSFLVPTNVLSSLQTAFSGQQVLLQSTRAEGMASVTLNLQGLAGRELCFTALPHIPTATNINTLPPQQQPPPAESSELASAVECPSLDQPAEHLAENRAGGSQEVSGVPGDVPQEVLSVPQGTSEGPDGESLTSLLNELVFLNQQTVTVTTPADQGSVVGEATEQGHASSPDVLEQDCGPVASEMDKTELNKNTNIGNTKVGVLSPPPLLQMKVGGANLSDASSCDDERGRREGGVAWRPMPRLVPLGLRGNPTP